MRPLLTIACILVALSALAPRAGAAFWKSSEYYCQVYLPDGSYVLPWYPLVPANEGGVLAGARRQDFQAMVYLGVVDEKNQPHFSLDEKSLEQLEKPFFGPGLGFVHTTQKVTLRGIDGYRLTGRHRFNGRSYAMVVDMYYAHEMVYEVAGLTTAYDNALQDNDVLAFMRSFYILDK